MRVPLQTASLLPRSLSVKSLQTGDLTIRCATAKVRGCDRNRAIISDIQTVTLQSNARTFKDQTMLRFLPLVAILLLPGPSCRNSGAQSNSVSPSTTVNSNQSQPLSTTSSTQKSRALPNGIWGGQGISLEINDSGADINYDCAHGSISGKIVPDGDGKFVAKGF